MADKTDSQFKESYRVRAPKELAASNAPSEKRRKLDKGPETSTALHPLKLSNAIFTSSDTIKSPRSVLSFDAADKHNRLALFLDDFSQLGQLSIVFVDLFLGTTISVPVQMSKYPYRFDDIRFSRVMFIDRDRLMVVSYDVHGLATWLYLLDFDAENRRSTALHRVMVPNFSTIVLNDSDSRKLLVKTTESISCARIDNDRIILNDSPPLNLDLHFLRYSGHVICGLKADGEHRIDLERLYIYDLTTRTTEHVTIETASLPKFTHFYSDIDVAEWTGDKLFVPIALADGISIYLLDMETRKWSRVIRGLPGYGVTDSAYNHGILSVCALEQSPKNSNNNAEQPDIVTAYRFPLRIPEKLENLAWFCIRRHQLFPHRH